MRALAVIAIISVGTATALVLWRHHTRHSGKALLPARHTEAAAVFHSSPFRAPKRYQSDVLTARPEDHLHLRSAAINREIADIRLQRVKGSSSAASISYPKARPGNSPILPGGYPNGERWLYIWKQQRTAYLMHDFLLEESFPCAVGRSHSRQGPDYTPIGWFRITNILWRPTWHPSARIRREYNLPERSPIPASDPRNALGVVWLGLNIPSIGLHGTNDPSRIGKPETHGCIAFFNEDIETIARAVQVSTRVYITE